MRTNGTAGNVVVYADISWQSRLIAPAETDFLTILLWRYYRPLKFYPASHRIFQIGNHVFQFTDHLHLLFPFFAFHILIHQTLLDMLYFFWKKKTFLF